jgi:hypothetical protein
MILRKGVTEISFPGTPHYSSPGPVSAPSQARAASAAPAASFLPTTRDLFGQPISNEIVVVILCGYRGLKSFACGYFAPQLVEEVFEAVENSWNWIAAGLSAQQYSPFLAGEFRQ